MYQTAFSNRSPACGPNHPTVTPALPIPRRRGLPSAPGLARIAGAVARRGFGVIGLLLSLAVFLGASQALADPAAPVQATVVNINTADAPTLAQRLRGVGQSRAQEIVRHREAFGPFASPDELLEVKGIGQSTLEQNRARITLE